MALKERRFIRGCLVMFGAIFNLSIWYFLLYQILTAVEASVVMWVAYWVYVPMSIFTSILSNADRLDHE